MAPNAAAATITFAASASGEAAWAAGRASSNAVPTASHAGVHSASVKAIAGRLNDAVDRGRRDERRDLARAGFEPIKHSRWCLLKRPEDLSPDQNDKLRELLRYNLRSVRAYLHKEAFEGFWRYRSPAWAGWFPDQWCTRVMRSRLAPLKAVARSLRVHKQLILNWFKANKQISQAVVEAMNGNAKLAIRKARGFRVYATLRIALFHQLGALPEPHFSTHRFW